MVMDMSEMGKEEYIGEEGGIYITQMPLRYIILQILNRLPFLSPGERYRTAMYLYNIFFPSLKKELDREIAENLRRENINPYSPTTRDYIIYGARYVEEKRNSTTARMREAFINAICKSVVTVMERHNLIETPYRETIIKEGI